MKISTLKTILRENRSLLLFIVLMVAFRSSIADWNEVPTGSMKPTIVEGDRILVNKLAYDIRIPLTNISLHKRANPLRGDIVVFDSTVAKKRLVKRVIGLPGDRVAMNNNRLTVNGIPIEYQTSNENSGRDLIENLLGIEHKVRIAASRSPLSSFKQTVVPAEHYLLLGDNRDNSADSRVIGFVPRNEIVGRTRQVVISLDYDKFYLPRSDRVLRSL